MKAMLTNWNQKQTCAAFLVILLFLAHMLLTWPILFRNLGEINQFDEVGHINKGRLLVEGQFPILADNPAVASFYGIFYLFTRDNDLWLLDAGNAGRIILFASLFWVLWLVAREALWPRSALVTVGLFAVLPIARNLLQNSSDALFAVFSGLSLWGLLRFLRASGLKHLLVCSAFLGLAALSRNDGLTLLPIMVGLALLAGAHRHGWQKTIAASIAPFVVLVGGYVFLFWIATGQLGLGTLHRTYFAFEQGQGVVYSEIYVGKNAFVEGQYTARSLFGTPDENQHSVRRAIGRNPGAFVRRVLHSVRNLPGMVVGAYGSRMNFNGFCDRKLDTGLGAVIVMLALWGGIVLWKKESKLPVLAIVLWPAFLLAYFITFFRPGYLLMPFYSVLILASVGLEDLLYEWSFPMMATMTYAALVCASVILYLSNQPQTLTTFGLVAIGFLAARIYRRTGSESSYIGSVCLLIMLAAGTAAAAPCWQYTLSSSAITFREKAALAMRKAFVERSIVATYADGAVVLAKMRPKLLQIQFSPDLRDIRSGVDLHNWLIRNGVVGVYVDPFLRDSEPNLYSLIRAELGAGLRLLYQSEDGEIMVARVEGH